MVGALNPENPNLNDQVPEIGLTEVRQICLLDGPNGLGREKASSYAMRG